MTFCIHLLKTVVSVTFQRYSCQQIRLLNDNEQYSTVKMTVFLRCTVLSSFQQTSNVLVSHQSSSSS